jgi:hypothetical protein
MMKGSDFKHQLLSHVIVAAISQCKSTMESFLWDLVEAGSTSVDTLFGLIMWTV